MPELRNLRRREKHVDVFYHTLQGSRQLALISRKIQADSSPEARMSFVHCPQQVSRIITGKLQCGPRHLYVLKRVAVPIPSFPLQLLLLHPNPTSIRTDFANS